MSIQERERGSGGRARRPLLLLSLLFLVMALIVWVEWRESVRRIAHADVSSSPSSSVRAVGGAVGCLGYIEPKNGVLQVTAAYFEGHPQRVLELKVQEGDEIRSGQLLAVLDGREQLESGAHLADARVNLARARLTLVKAGASAPDIAAQQAVVSQAGAALDRARSEYRRYAALRRQTDVSDAELDARRIAVQADEQAVEAANQRLQSISQVRPAEVDVAQAELDVATAEAQRARLNLKSAMVYASATGRVVNVYAYPGEEAGPRGLLGIAKTDSMYVVAEVYETDIERVHPGQQATMTSDLFPGQISGVVETVNTAISKASILPTDPVAFADARVFKVWLRLDDGRKVAGLIHGKVNVVIHQ